MTELLAQFAAILEATPARLAGMEAVCANHLAEALQYRSLLLPGPFLEGRETGIA